MSIRYISKTEWNNTFIYFKHFPLFFINIYNIIHDLTDTK